MSQLKFPDPVPMSILFGAQVSKDLVPEAIEKAQSLEGVYLDNFFEMGLINPPRPSALLHGGGAPQAPIPVMFYNLLFRVRTSQVEAFKKGMVAWAAEVNTRLSAVPPGATFGRG